MQRSVIKKIEKQIHIYVFKEELTQDELNDLMVFETIINDFRIKEYNKEEKTIFFIKEDKKK